MLRFSRPGPPLGKITARLALGMYFTVEVRVNESCYRFSMVKERAAKMPFITVDAAQISMLEASSSKTALPFVMR
jgi:hypothetical protein